MKIKHQQNFKIISIDLKWWLNSNINTHICSNNKYVTIESSISDKWFYFKQNVYKNFQLNYQDALEMKC